MGVCRRRWISTSRGLSLLGTWVFFCFNRYDTILELGLHFIDSVMVFLKSYRYHLLYLNSLWLAA